MFISQITASNLRSLDFISISPKSSVNVIIGKNNDGKTSLLEGIYYCSSLRSFKQVPTPLLIKDTKKSLKLLLNYTKITDNYTICLENRLNGANVNKINDKKASARQLFIDFPVLALNFGSSNIITGTSEDRRSFLDWGVFHVEHSYIDIYKDYQKALKQRNKLLKRSDKSGIDYWTELVIEKGDQLNDLRQPYFQAFNKQFILLKESISTLVPDVYTDILNTSLEFTRGWSDGKSLSNAIKESFEKDILLKHTTCGPHRADLTFKSSEFDLKSISSMSTQIITSLLMVMSQANMFHVKHKHNPIILIDDLFFGIDDKNLNLVINLLVRSKAQCFITAPDLYRDKILDICSDNENISTYEFIDKQLVEKNNGK